MADYSRRDVLKITTNILLTASGLMGLGGVLRYLSFSTEPLPPTEFDLGAASDYPEGSRTVLPHIPALLIHNETGFSALSLVCPHLGCTVKDNPDGLICPCHGSRFGTEGVPLRGPARGMLRSLRVEAMTDGQLRLFMS